MQQSIASAAMHTASTAPHTHMQPTPAPLPIGRIGSTSLRPRPLLLALLGPLVLACGCHLELPRHELLADLLHVVCAAAQRRGVQFGPGTPCRLGDPRSWLCGRHCSRRWRCGCVGVLAMCAPHACVCEEQQRNNAAAPGGHRPWRQRWHPHRRRQPRCVGWSPRVLHPHIRVRPCTWCGGVGPLLHIVWHERRDRPVWNATPRA